MMNFTHKPKYHTTPSDELFQRLFGFYPKKAGASFELLSTAVMWHLIESENIANVIINKKIIEAIHDKKVKDVASHQVDGIITCKNHNGKILNNIAIEAKDHHQDNIPKSVPIPEVQKIDSTIRDIEEFDSGVFFTSTDFSPESLNFIKGLSPKKHQKNVKLFKSRPSIKEDEKGRIKGFIINYTFKIPHNIIIPFISDKLAILPPIFCEYGNPLDIYDKDRVVISNTSQAIVDKFGDDRKIKSGFIEIRGYIKHLYQNSLIPIVGFYFDTKIETITDKHEIKSDGEPVLYVKSIMDNEVDTLITDTELKEKISQLLKQKGIDVENIKIK